MSDLGDLADAIEAEAEFWMHCPAGHAGQSGEMIPPMLLRLAEAIRRKVD
jgi:hypothetical protein